jgi:ABC-type transporter Mla subunit MlaD
VVTVLAAIAALGCAFYIVKNIAKTDYTSTREVGFTVTDASGVISGGRQEIRFKGIPAGTIDSVRLVDRQAVIEASLYAQFGPVYRNAQATLRPNTALQDMYIDIVNRGTPSAGLATTAAPLPLPQTTTSVQSADVLDAFQPDVRGHLATVLQELGGGLQGRGDALRSAFVEVVPFLQQAGRLSHQLAVRNHETRRLVHNVAVLTGELGQRQQDVRTLVEMSGATLRTLQGSAPNLDATLRELPPTLSAIQTSFAAVRAALPDLNQALVSLGPVASTLPGGLTAVRNLSDTALPAVRALQPPVQKLVPLTQALRPFAQNLQQAIAQLSPQVPAIDHVTRTVAGCSVALQGFFQWTPSVTKMWTTVGPGVRGDFAFGADNTGLIKDPNVSASPSCAQGGPTGGQPGPGLAQGGSK